MIDDNDRARIDRVKRGIQDGYMVPPIIITKDYHVIDGAHRLIACREMGLLIPCIVIDASVEYLDPKNIRCWVDGGSWLPEQRP